MAARGESMQLYYELSKVSMAARGESIQFIVNFVSPSAWLQEGKACNCIMNFVKTSAWLQEGEKHTIVL